MYQSRGFYTEETSGLLRKRTKRPPPEGFFERWIYARGGRLSPVRMQETDFKPPVSPEAVRLGDASPLNGGCPRCRSEMN